MGFLQKVPFATDLGSLACVWAFVCFALVFPHISLSFVQILLVQGTMPSVSYLKFGNVWKHTRAEAPLVVIKISKKTSPQRWRFSFTLHRNETTQTNPPQKHPRNARVISAKELGTIPNNNLIRISLDRRPIWGIHSHTLMISWWKPILWKT